MIHYFLNLWLEEESTEVKIILKLHILFMCISQILREYLISNSSFECCFYSLPLPLSILNAVFFPTPSFPTSLFPSFFLSFCKTPRDVPLVTSLLLFFILDYFNWQICAYFHNIGIPLQWRTREIRDPQPDVLQTT